jgi:hypothetical protein
METAVAIGDTDPGELPESQPEWNLWIPNACVPVC